jgi:hypothetical protein
MIQITEKQAREMAKNICINMNKEIIDIEYTITKWKIIGYIQKSKLEEARQSYITERFGTLYVSEEGCTYAGAYYCKEMVDEKIALYEEAIKELEARE